MTVSACKALLEKGEIELVDIREPWEVSICSLGGKHIVMHEIPLRFVELDPSKSYAVLCKTGRRAEPVVNLLQTEFGFSSVHLIEGGITEWFAQFDPTYEMY